MKTVNINAEIGDFLRQFPFLLINTNGCVYAFLWTFLWPMQFSKIDDSKIALVLSQRARFRIFAFNCEPNYLLLLSDGNEC